MACATAAAAVRRTFQPADRECGMAQMAVAADVRETLQPADQGCGVTCVPSEVEVRSLEVANSTCGVVTLPFAALGVHGCRRPVSRGWAVARAGLLSDVRAVRFGLQKKVLGI